MDPIREAELLINRRQFFGLSSAGIGAFALSSLASPGAHAGVHPAAHTGLGGVMSGFHVAPRAKRVIYMFQSGGPSQIDLFDHKPYMRTVHGTELPKEIRGSQRVTGMTSGQASFPVASSKYDFKQRGQSGTWISDQLPHTASVADDICVIRSMNTEAINHDPGITYMQTGHQQPGRPCMGAWMSYGLGAENQDLPGFIVLISQGSAEREAQALFQRLWGAGFLPSEHQGVNFRAGADPVLYLNNPPGIDRSTRRRMLDGLSQLNHLQLDAFADPEINTRISQYEMAYRMQASVPDLMDVSDEPGYIFDMYGPDARKPGTYAANCLLARRLAERGVRFIQMYHRDWDHHGDLPRDLELQCRDTDQPSAALVKDLKQRGLLEDTLLIWGGEFGRTIYCQGELTDTNYGRDHHGRCFSVWLAGGGVKPGLVYGATDDYSYNILENPVHVHDLNATVMHMMGIDHTRLTYRFQGRDYRLTDVHGKVVHDILT
ncbi:MAG: DUF1501 domain-containing protein [Candidatus Hydrogenedentes bacterium]|nr:DUF1501 domain-containing protein [Candidatus Hydrogenedentota bacterium]